ncbi:MAG: S8 family serine peptidase [Candidatus Thorarchaeota archaeon]
MLDLHKKRAVVLLLIVTLSGSLFIAPAIVMRMNEATPLSTSPTMVDQAIDMIDSINQRLNDPIAREQKVDSLFASYITTEETTTEMDTSHGGVDFLVVLYPGTDVDAVRENAKVYWAIDMGFATYVYGTVFSPAKANILTKLDGLMYISADKVIPEVDMTTDVPEPDMFEIADDLGASGAEGLGYTGDGVTVAITDFSTDFSIPDLVDAVDVDASGRPTSYDPSGIGTQMLTYANATNVADVDAWLAAGYALTYYNATTDKYYLNVTGWDPIMARAPFSASAHYLRTLRHEHFGLYGGGLDTLIDDYLWKDWELPAPGSFDNYTVGWVFELRDDQFAAMYAPALVIDASKLIIDWGAMAAYSKLINEYYWQETVENPYAPDYVAELVGMMDWSFEDDYSAGWYYTVDGTGKGPVVHYNDGTNYYGLGSLGWIYDNLNFYTYYFNETYFAGTGMNATDEVLFCGFRADGLGFGLIYSELSLTTATNHGQWLAGAIASRGVYGHKVYQETDPLNDTEYYLPGVATGATVMSIKNFGYASTFDDFGGTFWACGFHLNTTSGMWEYTGEHKAEILSMSWGWGTGSQFDLFWTTLAFDAMSVPGYADPNYEGILMFSSAGNSGPGYMSGGAPATGGLVVCVGGTTKNHYYDNLYSEGQINANSPAPFSSMGPNFLGYPKPDVVAPGYRGVNPQPIQNIMYEGLPWYWSYTVGGPAETYKWWQGTSLSSPLAAAVAAVALEAMMDKGWGYDPYVLKEVVLSSATDLGMDPFIQGHGQVNAYEACLAIDGLMNDRYYFQSSDTMDNYYESAYICWRYWIATYPYYEIPWPAAVGGDNWLDIPPDIWASMNYPPGHPNAPYPLNETPALTSSIFFGDVFPGDTETVTVNATGYDGVDYDLGAGYTATAWEYVMSEMLSFDATTYTYLDHNFDPAVETDGVFNMTKEFMDAGYTEGQIDAAFADPYAFFVITFDEDYIGDIVVSRLFDWADDGPGDLAGNGEMNFYNIFHSPWGQIFSASDTIRNIGRGYNEFNSMIIRVSDVAGLSNIFQNTPTLQVTDTGATLTSGHDFKVSLITWEVQTGPLAIVSNTGGFNVSVTPTSDEYGTHAGFVMVDSGTWTHQIPYSYNVAVDLDVAEGAVITLADGMGTDFNPFDNGAVFAAADLSEENFAGAGDKRTFRIEVPEPVLGGPNAGNGSVLAFKVSWENPGTVVDMYLTDSYESDYFYAQTNNVDYPLNQPPVRPTYNTMVFAGGPEDVYLYRGEWYLQLVVSAWNGTDPFEEITLEMQWFMDMPSTTLESTYTANGVPATSFGSGETLAGDHVVLNFTYTDYSFPLNPDFEIVETELAFLSGLFFEDYDIPLVVPTAAFPPAFPFNNPDSPLPADQVSVAILKGLAPGDPVRVTAGFDIGDCDFMVFDGTQPWAYSNDYMGGNMATGANPETGSFTWTSTNDTMILLCWNYDQDPGTWYYNVDTRSAEAQPVVPGRTVTYDTYDFFYNITKDIQVTAYTGTEVAWVETLNAVRFGNFFNPTIELLAPMGGEDWSTGTHNVTFTAADANGDDIFFQIRFSKDGGTYWEILYTGPAPYDAANGYFYYSWSTTSILATDEALIEVTALDNDTAYAGQFGLPNPWPANPSIPDRSDDVFSLGSGTIPGPTTPTTTPSTTPTTTPTTPPTTPPPPIDPLLLGLIAGIGVGVVVVLILFLVKKR